MRRPRPRTALTLALAVAGAVVLTGGTALAYWTTTGSGTGSATANSAQGLQVSEPGVTGLYPTGRVTGRFTVTNPNPFDVSLTGATAGAVTVDGAHAGCNVESVTFSLGQLPTSPVPAGGGTVEIGFTAAMSNAALDACQGATFSLPLTVDAQSAG